MELMMAQQTQLKCEVYDLQKKLEAMKQQTELKCEVADLMKVIRRYQETWVDGALVESEKKAVQDYIAELKSEISQHKQEFVESVEYGGELFRENQKLKYENGELKEEIANLKEMILLQEDSDLEEDEGYDEIDYEGVAYYHKNGIVYSTNFEEVGTWVWDGHKHTIDWTDEDAEKRHNEDKDDTDDEEEVVEVPVDPWRKLENAFHLGNAAHKKTDKGLFRLKVEGLTPAEIITKAKEHCETEVYGGFSYNRNKNKVYFYKSIAAPRVINKDNPVVYDITYTKFGWHDLYINGAGYGAC